MPPAKTKFSKLKGKFSKTASKSKDQEEDSTIPLPLLKGCGVPEPSICTIGIPWAEGEDGIQMICTNQKCPVVKHLLHEKCFEDFDNRMAEVLSKEGSARGWTDRQVRANLWVKKGLDIVGKYCRCQCGLGRTRLDLDAKFEREKRLREEELKASAAVKGVDVAILKAKQSKPKKNKASALPTLNYGFSKGPAALLHPDERDDVTTPPLSVMDTTPRQHLPPPPGFSPVKPVRPAPLATTPVPTSVTSVSIRNSNRRDSVSSISSVPNGEGIWGRKRADSIRSDMSNNQWQDVSGRTTSVLSGNLADQDDCMSLSSRTGDLQDLVPAPLPPAQTRSYAAIFKRDGTFVVHPGHLDDLSPRRGSQQLQQPLTVHTEHDTCTDSGVELKSGDSSVLGDSTPSSPVDDSTRRSSATTDVVPVGLLENVSHEAVASEEDVAVSEPVNPHESKWPSLTEARGMAAVLPDTDVRREHTIVGTSAKVPTAGNVSEKFSLVLTPEEERWIRGETQESSKTSSLSSFCECSELLDILAGCYPWDPWTGRSACLGETVMAYHYLPLTWSAY